MVARRRVAVALSGLAVLRLLAGPAAGSADAASPTSSVPFQRDQLMIETGKGPVAITIELALTDEQKATGLMFRNEVPEHTGMLFDYGYPQDVAMWMKNTLVPLDMLFIAEDGRITRIVKRTQPHSLATIPSGGRVRAVLELAGGATDRLSIKEGDFVRHPRFAAAR